MVRELPGELFPGQSAIGVCRRLSHSDSSLRHYKLEQALRASLRMPSHRPGVPTGKSKVRVAERSFKSEMERQLLEIHDAFGVFVDDTERKTRDLLERLRATEQEKQEAEDRLREMERQKQGVEDQLRELARQLRSLQKTPAMRIIRLIRRSNPFRSARERIR